VGADPKASILLASDFGQPNGLCFSLDGHRLFVNDTERQHIRVFDVAANGALSGGKVWAETTGKGEGAPDGMKIDSAGNVYCCGPGGIHVFDPAAVCLGVIQVPEGTANMAWGDADLRSLFITASTSVYRIRSRFPDSPRSRARRVRRTRDHHDDPSAQKSAPDRRHGRTGAGRVRHCDRGRAPDPRRTDAHRRRAFGAGRGHDRSRRANGDPRPGRVAHAPLLQQREGDR
ncbi:MAG: SMP-30/gluconolactonase/LRE family protein, partial [Gammaproteobacteria bacterium]|nr:SMP-30/gluconolactonase/LRE family protein [Gammaproteobacteria bacterium]